MAHRIHTTQPRPIRWASVTTAWLATIAVVPLAFWIALCRPDEDIVLAVVAAVLITGIALGGTLGMIARRVWRAG